VKHRAYNSAEAYVATVITLS